MLLLLGLYVLGASGFTSRWSTWKVNTHGQGRTLCGCTAAYTIEVMAMAMQYKRILGKIFNGVRLRRQFDFFLRNLCGPCIEGLTFFFSVEIFAIEFMFRLFTLGHMRVLDERRRVQDARQCENELSALLNDLLCPETSFD